MIELGFGDWGQQVQTEKLDQKLKFKKKPIESMQVKKIWQALWGI